MRNLIIFLAALLFAAILIPSSLSAQTEESTAGYYAVCLEDANKASVLIRYFEEKPQKNNKIDDKDILLVSEELSTINLIESDAYLLNYTGFMKDITTIKLEVDEDFKPINTNRWFAVPYYAEHCYREVTTIEGLENLNTENVTDMSQMFYGCTGLTSLNLSTFNTENVTDMRFMFGKCEKLKNLDLSSFNTEKVTNMNEMFRGCKSLETLNLSSFNTANVEKMESMFSDCEYLESLDLSSFNTEKVTSMSDMFWGCSALETLNLSSFNTANVYEMHGMFSGCENLESLDLSSFNTEKVENMNSMFRDCKSLETLNLSNFKTDSLVATSGMFDACSSLKKLNLGNFNAANVRDANAMFKSCSSLDTLDLGSFNFNAKYLENMFDGCENLKILDLGTLDIDIKPYENNDDGDWNGTIAGMFRGCKSLNYIFCNKDSKISKEILKLGEERNRRDLYEKCFEACSSLTAVKTNGSEVQWQEERGDERKLFNFADKDGYFTKKTNDTIVISTLPTKTIYKYGEPLSLEGGFISKTIEFGKDKSIVLDLCALEDLSGLVEGYDSQKLGEQEVFVSYGGKKLSFKVEVKDVLNEVKVESEPTTSKYQIPFTEDDIDLTGGKIKKVYASGKNADFSMLALEYTLVDSLEANKLGEQSLKLSFDLGDTNFVWEYKIELVESLEEGEEGGDEGGSEPGGEEGGDEPGTDEPGEGGEGEGDEPGEDKDKDGAVEDLNGGVAAFEAWSTGGVLYVSAVRGGVLDVMSVNGVVVRREKLASGSNLNLALETGVYVLKLGGDLKKVIVE